MLLPVLQNSIAHIVYTREADAFQTPRLFLTRPLQLSVNWDTCRGSFPFSKIAREKQENIARSQYGNFLDLQSKNQRSILSNHTVVHYFKQTDCLPEGCLLVVVVVDEILEEM